jgi:ATP-binding cassette subfamily F protein uup
VEIDRGKLYSYQTNYSGYLELKAAREESALASERKRQSILRVELAWMQRGARARSTKQKAHIQRYEALSAQKGPEAQSQVELSSISTRMGRTTVELEHISKSYGEKVLIRDFSYIFLKKDRVGFIGANGSGKSTLMKMIMGLVTPDSGTITIGQTIKIGYYAQELNGDASMDPNQKIIDYIKDTAEFVRTEDGLISASAMLERFLFPPEKQYSQIGKLSGGEKRRLNLLRVLMDAPNVLIFDEPTNDLDIQTLVILEDYLDSFDGIVMAVSHDRYFLDRTMKRIFSFEGDGIIRQYEGGYTDYALRKEEERETEESLRSSQSNGKNTGGKSGEEETKKTQRSRGPAKLKFSYKEQKDYETIEGDIALLEEKMDKLDQEITAASHDFVKLNQLMAEKEETEAKLEEKMERWMYLEDLAARMKEQSNT